MPNKKSMFVELITDWKHYLGWTLTTLILILTMHLLGKHCVHTPFYIMGVIFLVIIIVDILKHLIKLQ